MQLTFAAGGALLDNAPDDPDASDDGLSDGLHAKSHLIGSAQLRTGPWLLGADYLQSDAASENIAYVAQARYKVSKALGHNTSMNLRYYDAKIITTGVDGQSRKRSRLQLNFNIKF